MAQEYYQKQVIGNWFSPYTKEEAEISALTYELSQQPNREKILVKELSKNFPDCSDFYYYDDQKEEFFDGMPVYPRISIGSVVVREITDDFER